MTATASVHSLRKATRCSDCVHFSGWSHIESIWVSIATNRFDATISTSGVEIGSLAASQLYRSFRNLLSSTPLFQISGLSSDRPSPSSSVPMGGSLVRISSTVSSWELSVGTTVADVPFSFFLSDSEEMEVIIFDATQADDEREVD